MPILLVGGLSDATLPHKFAECAQVLTKSTLGVEALGLTKESDVTVQFPMERVSRDGSEIIIWILGLHAKLERTAAVVHQLVDQLGGAAMALFPHARRIEVLPGPLVDPALCILVDRSPSAA